MRSRVRNARLALLVVVAAVLGCASATKRLEQGTELEEQGRYPEAAARYIQALRKDPNLPEARERLARIGAHVIAMYRNDAARFRVLGSFVQAADLYHASDALVRDAAGVGVPLTVPEGYRESRRTTFDEAIDQLLRSGRSAEARYLWAEALTNFEQVASYEPSARQEGEAMRARIRVLVLWGEGDLEAGRYRAAYGRADAALVLLAGNFVGSDPRGGDLLGGQEPSWAERAERVRNEALSLGTVHVVVTPVRAGHQVGRELPEGFLLALSDELELDHWSAPPLFVAVLDPVVVRRELHRWGQSRSALSVRESARLGRDLGASHVVRLEVESLTASDLDVVEKRVGAKTRARADTTYTVLEGTRHYDLVASAVLVDVGRAREVARRSIESTSEGRFSRGEYRGDARELQLSTSERRLFDRRREREEEQQIQNRLIEKTAALLAGQTFDALVACVP